VFHLFKLLFFQNQEQNSGKVIHITHNPFLLVVGRKAQDTTYGILSGEPFWNLPSELLADPDQNSNEEPLIEEARTNNG